MDEELARDINQAIQESLIMASQAGGQDEAESSLSSVLGSTYIDPEKQW